MHLASVCLPICVPVTCDCTLNLSSRFYKQYGMHFGLHRHHLEDLGIGGKDNIRRDIQEIGCG